LGVAVGRAGAVGWWVGVGGAPPAVVVGVRVTVGVGESSAPVATVGAPPAAASVGAVEVLVGDVFSAPMAPTRQPSAVELASATQSTSSAKFTTSSAQRPREIGDGAPPDTPPPWLPLLSRPSSSRLPLPLNADVSAANELSVASSASVALGA